MKEKIALAIKICSLEEVVLWKKKDIGYTEENVKIKIAVPLLLFLGHQLTQLDFEHYGIDIFLKDLPRECQVIVETKSLGQNLDAHLPQLKKYADQTNALFAIISNGEETRVYALPYEIPICSIQRKELTEPANVELLKKFLSRQSLETKESLVNLYEEALKIKKTLLQRYKDLIATSEALKKYIEPKGADEETKKLISKAKQMGLLPIPDKIDETMAHSKSLEKLLDKLGKLLK